MLLVATALVLWLAGAAIGATGIGGVLVVPALTLLAGRSVLDAVAASTLSFAATGAAAAWRARRSPLLGADAASPSTMWTLNLAALSGAALGAVLAASVPGNVLRVVVALLALTSGLHALVGGTAPARPDRIERPWPSAPVLAACGIGVGVGSALSGTGGPVLLLPLLMLLHVPLRAAVLAGQRIQLPVALAASAVHIAGGRIDWALSAGLAAALLTGWWFGDRLGARVPVAALRRGVAVLLVATGAWYGWAAWH